MHSLRQHPLSLSLSTSHGHPLRASIITEALRSLNLLVLSIFISSFSLRAALTSPPASLSSMCLPSQSIPVQSRQSNAVASSGSLIKFYIICCYPFFQRGPAQIKCSSSSLSHSAERPERRGALHKPAGCETILLVSRPEPARDYKIING
jgi:hypothetical protein